MNPENSETGSAQGDFINSLFGDDQQDRIDDIDCNYQFLHLGREKPLKYVQFYSLFTGIFFDSN